MLLSHLGLRNGVSFASPATISHPYLISFFESKLSPWVCHGFPSIFSQSLGLMCADGRSRIWDTACGAEWR